MPTVTRKMCLFSVVVFVALLAGCHGSSDDNNDGGLDGALPELPVGQPLADAPPDPLAGSGKESCAIFQEQRCNQGVLENCAVFDTQAGSFVDNVDPLLHRVLLYERWHDLYHQPDGQTADRVFVGETPAGTPEEQWGSLEHFDHYIGMGDSGIWTGVALNAYALRYLQTGTQADYQRMEDKARRFLTLFDVTGIPGYLARHHALLMEPEALKNDAHILIYNPDQLDHRDHFFDPSIAPDLPSVYTEGFTDSQNKVHQGRAFWHGNTSIDQYAGPMQSLSLVYGLLRDESLKERIAKGVTCYLKRLKRLEVRNLQKNPEALDAIQNFFIGGADNFDPDDIDFKDLDTLVAYALLQPNSLNTDTFERACPDTIALDPYLVLDATSDEFVLDLFALAQDLQARDKERPNGIDHVYVVNVRGSDAMHLMHLASMAYYFTGDEMYRKFLYEELKENLKTIKVAHTMGALIMPRWCRTYYGSHITFGPLWDFLELLGDCPLRDEMYQVMEIEMWQKMMQGLKNAKFNLMYAGSVPDSIAASKEQAVAEAVEALETLGGNGGVFEDPRRTYTLDRQWLLSNMPAGNATICPTEEQRAICEDGYDVYGFKFLQNDITGDCQAVAGECPVGDGCAEAMAENALPMSLSIWEDFIWQRSPYKIGAAYPVEGFKQSPGLDLIESFWLARNYEFITEGKGQVLAWKEAGLCN